MSSNFRLVFQNGPDAGSEYLLDKMELFVGRDNSNEVVINDTEVSRKHARLVMEGSTYRLEDLGSTNGTFVRGQRILTPILLTPGDLITFGDKIVLKFEPAFSDPNATVIAQRSPRQVAQPSRPAPVSAIPPAPSMPMAQPQIPSTPVYQPIPAAPVYPTAAPKKNSKALVIVLIILGALVLLCVIPWIIVDLTNSYCSLFPGILNMLFPGACP